MNASAGLPRAWTTRRTGRPPGLPRCWLRPAPRWWTASQAWPGGRLAPTARSLHPSPNAGWCEAAFAGALGVRLGGPVRYSGRTENRPVLGAGRPPEPADIRRAIRLSRAVTAAAAGAAAAVALALDPPAARLDSASRRGPPLAAVRHSYPML